MGFVKESKADVARSHAKRARTEHHFIFVYLFKVPGGSSTFSGSVAGAAEVIEAIEMEGWKMDLLTQGPNDSMLMTFRSVERRLG